MLVCLRRAKLDKMLNPISSVLARDCFSKTVSNKVVFEDDLAGAGSHPSGNIQSGDAGLEMIAEHGKVATWGSDQSQWTPEQQAWYDRKQWGGYYDESGNWVPVN